MWGYSLSAGGCDASSLPGDHVVAGDRVLRDVLGDRHDRLRAGGCGLRDRDGTRALGLDTRDRTKVRRDEPLLGHRHERDDLVVLQRVGLLVAALARLRDEGVVLRATWSVRRQALLLLGQPDVAVRLDRDAAILALDADDDHADVAAGLVLELLLLDLRGHSCELPFAVSGRCDGGGRRTGSHPK
jgi:hypothetical protein